MNPKPSTPGATSLPSSGGLRRHALGVVVFALALVGCSTTSSPAPVVDEAPAGSTKRLLAACHGRSLEACYQSTVLLLDRGVSLREVCFPEGDDRPGLEAVVAVAVDALEDAEAAGNDEAAAVVASAFSRAWPCASKTPGSRPIGFETANRIEPNHYTSGGTSPPEL